MSKRIGARVFEYKDNFLMEPKSAHEQGEWLDGYCFASNAAENDLAQLASLVGSKSTLRSSSKNEEIAMVEDAPALEFDLEDELAKAFQTDEMPQEPEFELAGTSRTPAGRDEMAAEMRAATAAAAAAAAGAADDVARAPKAPPVPESTGLADISAITDLGSQPQSGAVDLDDLAAQQNRIDPSEMDARLEPLAEFNDMIASELDRALAREFAADDELLAEQSPPVQPKSDIEQELSRLMGLSPTPPSQVSDADGNGDLSRNIAAPAEAEEAEDQTPESAPPIPIMARPPAPAEVVEPWQSAEVVEEPPLPEPAAAEPEISSHSIYAPVQMSDFDPVSADPPEPELVDESDEFGEASPPQPTAGLEHIDTVLGGAAALAAAASSPGADQKTQNGQSDPLEESVLADHNSESIAPEIDDELRLRLDELEFQPNRNNGRTGRRAAAAIVAVALLGGTAALAWNFVGGNNGDTPTLLASTDPVKVKPENAGGKVVPNQDQAVYQAAEEQGRDTSQQARLTDTTEQPISVSVSPTGEKNAARISGNQPETNLPLSIKPRSVRTVVVRPDGTIVRSATPKAQVAVVPNDSLQSSLQGLQDQVKKEATQLTANFDSSQQKPANDLSPNKVKVQSLTTSGLRTTDTASTNPVPEPRKVETSNAVQPVQQQPVQVAAVKPKPAPSAPAATAAPANESLPQVASPYAVQISSQRSAAAAKQSFATLNRRYANIINGRGVDIRRVQVKGKTYYRVRIPAEDRSTANQICGQMKSRGGDCFVTR
ncbi:MAG: SPOR domain-containing protein [Rhizobiaceae bacterium]